MEIQPPTLDELINWLDTYIEKIAAAKLDETAALLRIARLDLIVRANGVSEDELEAFLLAAESEKRVADHIAPPELKKRRRKAAGFAANN
jgi:hypothetical protein